MKLGKVRRFYGAELNMAPLIDCVFQLLIYFMVVSQVAKVDVEPITLPEAVEGKEPKKPVRGQLVINVRQNGQIVMGGQVCTPEILRGLLAREARERGAKELRILVRGDREAPWRKAAAVLRACAANGVENVRVAVVEAAQP